MTGCVRKIAIFQSLTIQNRNRRGNPNRGNGARAAAIPVFTTGIGGRPTTLSDLSPTNSQVDKITEKQDNALMVQGTIPVFLQLSDQPHKIANKLQAMV